MREWRMERINKCKEACDGEKIGYMYKCLRKIGMKVVKAAESNMMSIRELKNHFECVMKKSLKKFVVCL